MGCTSGYKFPVTGSGQVDFDDVFVRKEFFSEGGLWVWGYGGCGSLGNNAVVARSSPVQTVAGGTNWKQVSSSSIWPTNTHGNAAGIKTDGTLWLWGTGCRGQLGTNAILAVSSPVQTVSGGTNWKQVSISDSITAAIKTDGTLWLWGRGATGVLGNNLGTDQSSPVQTVSAGTKWKQVSVFGDNTIVSAAAIKTDGTLWLWGTGTVGQLGTNAILNVSSPVQTVSGGTNWKQVSTGLGFTAAIKTDGTLWLWGSNSNGRMGNGVNNGAYSSPIQTVSGGTNWKQVSAGDDGVAAIKTDGTLWLWGDSSGGQLGDNTSTFGAEASSPVQTISGGANWKCVSRGISGVAAIKTDGTLWLWGCDIQSGGAGSLGNNSVGDRSSPVQTVSGGTNWKTVAKSFNTIAIREDCW